MTAQGNGEEWPEYVHYRPLSVPPPAGGDGPEMTAWQHAVESRLAQLHEDIRALGAKVDRHLLFVLGALVTAALGLAGLMARGFGWI